MTAAERAITIEDLRQQALRRLPRFVMDPFERGAGDGAGNRRNIDAFRQHLLLPRALVDVTPVDTATTVFGRRYASPIGISAVGSAGIYRRHADQMLAEVAREANIPFILSGAGTAAVWEIARIAPEHLWFQLYGARDPALTDKLMGRAADAGVQVLVLTVDYPVHPRNEASIRTGVSLISSPPWRNWPGILWDAATHPRWALPYVMGGGRPPLAGWAVHAPPNSNASDVARFFVANGVVNHTWHEVERVRAFWKGSLVIKGIVHPADARKAVDLGADAITVSNHGGNKLDCMPASLDSLAAVRQAVSPSTPVFFDGGLRRGSDIVVAQALGASHCFLGRATLYGVAAGGRSGGRRAVEILDSELKHTMAMVGCKRLADITPACLVGSQLQAAAISS